MSVAPANEAKVEDLTPGVIGVVDVDMAMIQAQVIFLFAA